MSKHMASIEIYGNCVDDFEVSPFESINMLHRRSDLERVSHELSYEERMKLLSYDMKLVKNSEKMSKQIGEVYDFALSKEPLSQWWWHLDKVANGKIAFHLSPTFESDLEI
ncbi:MULTISPECIES: hypothetical protein [Brevibacillus]|uniref:hypothetical protein n=1 Tax=Brevibacillus TaxID=55080 RepID=UPI001D0A9E13|nr:hypothetical protein [Brevibacillus borstelensis]MCC0567048.1 hypothetical protein [Brevibacillus borstelensis]MCM3473389.1 hypothetical protein [Brevibacillus borstelensis]MED1850097.1 hypothetical protein [Brevibacillus borstelensis]